jgi:hypothetical protein
MDGEGSALEIWRQRLRYLQEQEAIASEPAQKFQLKIQIQEAKQKVAELESDLKPEAVRPRREPEDPKKLERRWFILGCVPLLFAVTLVIWGVSLRFLTEDQRHSSSAYLGSSSGVIESPVSSPALPTAPTLTPTVTPTPKPASWPTTQAKGISYVLTTTTDPVRPGEVAQFTISVHNLTDKSAHLELTFHVPKFTAYGSFPEGAAAGLAGRWVDAGASVSVNVDLKVLGGNRSPPDGSIITLVLTDLDRGASVSLSTTVNAAPVATLDLSTSPGTVASGETFSYLLAYHNASKDSLAGAQLSMTVPVGVSLVSTDGGGVLGADHAVHWPLGTVAAGATGQVHLNLKASIAKGDLPALLVQAALRDGGDHVLAQASNCKAVYAAPTFSYVLTTTTDPVQPGEVAQFTISVHNLTDKSAHLELTFHVPKFTAYDSFPEGAAAGLAGRWVDAGASVSVNVDLKVLGGNRSPPDGSIITLVLTDLNCGASVSLSVGVGKAVHNAQSTDLQEIRPAKIFVSSGGHLTKKEILAR